MSELPSNAEHAVTIGEITVATIKAAPPAIVTGMHLAGFSIADWLAVAMLVYTLVQLALLLERRWRNTGDK